ncbi:MAG: menaquinone biosynthetic enzyme MqnA/MqnD family protein [Acidobacteriota bacterium]
MVSRLRIHGLDSLNAAPLQWGLADGSLIAGRPVEFATGTPAESAAALATNRADVALIPSIELQRIESLSVVPGICVAARRRVRSVLLLARREISQVRTVAVDTSSRTSAILVRILLQRRLGIEPTYVPCAPDAQAMLSRCDAALLIADAALGRTPPGVVSHDLAELWFEWTGLPFVFAVWAARPGLDMAALTGRLEEVRVEGRRHIPDLARRGATRPGLPDAPDLERYLRELLHYTLGPEEEASLLRFFDEAYRAGALHRIRPLRIAPRNVTPLRAFAGESS